MGRDPARERSDHVRRVTISKGLRNRETDQQFSAPAVRDVLAWCKTM